MGEPNFNFPPNEIHLFPDTVLKIGQEEAEVVKTPCGQDEFLNALIYHPARNLRNVDYNLDNYMAFPREQNRYIFFCESALEINENETKSKSCRYALHSFLERSDNFFYIRPASPGSNYAIEMRGFNLNLIEEVMSEDSTTPIVVFDETRAWVLCFDNDMEYSFLCSDRDLSELLGEPVNPSVVNVDFWKCYVSEHEDYGFYVEKFKRYFPKILI